MSRNLNFTVLKALRKRKGLTLSNVSKRTGISPTTLSGLENNNGNPNLDTLVKLADVLEIKLSNILALAEQSKPIKHRLAKVRMGGFHFGVAKTRGAQFFWGKAHPQESVTAAPEIHETDYEVCVVLKGSVRFTINGKPHVVNAGEVLEFDCIFEHTYHAMEESEVVIMHFPK